MGKRQPFVLIDRPRGGALAFTDPGEIFVAHAPSQVVPLLAAIDRAREKGATIAGHLAYEAGLAIEPVLRGRANARAGAAGPLAWFAAFDRREELDEADLAHWFAAQAGSGSTPPSLGPLAPQLSPGAYHEAFDVLQNAIAGGDIYQANLTLPLAGAYRGDAIALYAALRREACGKNGALLFDGSHWLLSLSPELFIAVEGGEATARPMKGTRPRGASSTGDEALRADLAASSKDKAENLMIVDLMRNDLSRIAEPGSVVVETLFAVESYPTVHQMVSTVRARLREEVGFGEAIRALFPCGSITGAPKIRAMELLAETERDARGPYCGAIGAVAADGAMRFNVAIRTLRLTPADGDVDGLAVLGVGGGVVADSDAMDEWREAQLKAAFARSPAVTGADLVETMRFTPDEGIPLLERHLERMKASAEALGFSFDRHAARNRIQALCFDLDRPAKLRLLASRGGAIALETGALPPPRDAPLRCIALPLPVDPGDWRLRHKTTDRDFYEQAAAAAREAGADEALLVHPDGWVTEGSVTNIFLQREDALATPPAELGLLPGVLRGSLLASDEAVETRLTLDDLVNGFLLGNAVRGLVSARLL